MLAIFQLAGFTPYFLIDLQFCLLFTIRRCTLLVLLRSQPCLTPKKLPYGLFLSGSNGCPPSDCRGYKTTNPHPLMSQSEPVRRKGGRPPSEQKRDQQMTVLLTKLEKLAIKKRAQKAGLSLSDYGRQMVLTGKAQVRLTPEENATLNEMAKLGNNLNQIAHKANADGIRSIAFDASRLLQQLSQLLNKPSDS